MRLFFLSFMLIVSTHALGDKCKRNFASPVYHQKDLYHASTVTESLGIHYDDYEYEEDPMHTYGLSYYRAVVTRRYRTKRIIAEVVSAENRFGVPEQLAKRFSQWPKQRNGRLVGVGYPDSSHSFEGQFGLQQQLEKLGIWNEVENALRTDRFADEKAVLFSKVKDGLTFYRKSIDRRKWSLSFKEQMLQEAYDAAERSTNIKLRWSDQRVVANLQIIRAPFGRRRLKLRETGEVLSDHIGNWGLSVRRLSPLAALEVEMTDESQFHWQSLLAKLNNLGPFDAFETQRTATEDKMRQQNLVLEKTAQFERTSTGDIFGQDVVIEWAYGEVFELAKFAIDPSLNAAAYVEVATQLLSFMLDPSFSEIYNLSNRFALTMSEIPELYERLGFRKTGQIIIIDSKPTYIMRANPTDIMAAIRDARRALDANDVPRLEKLKVIISAVFEGMNRSLAL